MEKLVGARRLEAGVEVGVWKQLEKWASDMLIRTSDQPPHNETLNGPAPTYDKSPYVHGCKKVCSPAGQVAQLSVVPLLVAFIPSIFPNPVQKPFGVSPCKHGF